MGIEAFIWRYENGETAPFPLAEVLEAFSSHTLRFDEESGVLSVQFGDEIDSCDIYLGKESALTSLTHGIMISRPVRALELWECVFKIMQFGNVTLFFSDDTTPLYATAGAPDHFPGDLLDSLGEPKQVATAQEIVETHEA